MLFDPIFEEAARNMEPGEILSSLSAKGVVGEDGELNASAVRGLAKTDQAVVYQGHYCSHTEMELHRLAYMVHARGNSLSNVRVILGGDCRPIRAN